MFDIAVDTCPFVSDSVPDWYQTQEMCDEIVFEDLFTLKHCLDRYKTQEMCNKAINTFLLTLKFVPDWFVASKMIKKLLIIYPLMIIHIFSNKNDIVSVYHNNINLNNVNFDEYDPKAITHGRLMVFHNRFKKCKAFLKN